MKNYLFFALLMAFAMLNACQKETVSTDLTSSLTGDVADRGGDSLHCDSLGHHHGHHGPQDSLGHHHHGPLDSLHLDSLGHHHHPLDSLGGHPVDSSGHPGGPHGGGPHGGGHGHHGGN